MKPSMRAKLEHLDTRLAELNSLLTSEEATKDMDAYRKLTREHSDIATVVEQFGLYKQAEADAQAAEEMRKDPEMKDFADEEQKQAQLTMEELEDSLQKLLLPKDENDERNVFLEIRAGTGGDESALFAADLLRMYTRFAERQSWKVEIVSATESDLGGYKDISMAIKSKGTPEPGKAPFAKLKFEGGVHRVQRVPETESQGRVHTSAAGVLILPEAEEVDVEINMNDLRIDVYRSSGPGGQGVNTTDSAVRITHIPTGIVVSCQNERSQIQNRATAMAVLQSKLLEKRHQEERAKIDALRGDSGGSWGNQIRSYVLHPYQMVKDHRTDFETGNTQAVLDGELDGFIAAGIRWRRGGK